MWCAAMPISILIHFYFLFLQKMKTGLMILLLIHLASVTLATVVPAAVDAQVTAVADKKDVIITSTESVESAESIESLGDNDPKLTSGTPADSADSFS